MYSKKKIFEPLCCSQIDRASTLCTDVTEYLKKFRADILYLESNQLFQGCFQNRLLQVANHLDELSHLLIGLISPKNIYYSSLRTALAAINNTPNVLIITAYYLNPDYKYKRLLNKHCFQMELNQILNKVNFVEKILERLALGNPVSKDIARPVVNFRSR
ncbi:hypothetical protein P7L54_04975 [Acinetobacter bereziniae]|uniref:hypothetical protein n=1 Tax=Acinetobacter bereziniae TaxID=106648 RepID=UPI001906FB0C|nr:hypothetical protein [Acinetobacter bereziniae]MDG3555302.1 hypothetical protein [Acinetobacter bereziniae]QQC81434.1 hypothetical protein I9192_04870 [Acinetobacter bereziniae]UUN94544.1 hypothetical protein I9189_004890 [Acinetobacter bereziniae]WMW75608.1 hypothetical protein RG306_04855 [Acinetobacter bereziniae]